MRQFCGKLIEAASTCLHNAVLVCAVLLTLLSSTAQADSQLGSFLQNVAPSDLVPGAESFGPQHAQIPVMPALRGGKTVGWVFLTSDFVPTTGYSGKPIHILAGVSPDAVITGVRLVKHSEPIVLVGIPEAKIKAVTEGYAGLDLKKEAQADGSAHALDIVSGATVTVMVIDDSILRAGLKVARALGLDGLSASHQDTASHMIVNREAGLISDWETLVGDGSLRRFQMDVGAINRAFAGLGDPRAAEHAEAGPDDDAFIDIWVGLASQPAIGRSLLGDAAYANLKARLEEGDEVIFVGGAGRWSFKGSGYVRGGLFDRIQLIQGGNSHRFRDKEHMRVVRLAAAGAPDLKEADLFIVPKAAGFDPAQPWRLQLLVQRAVGPIEKLFQTFDVSYTLPRIYLAVPPVPPATAVDTSASPSRQESAAGIRDALWQKIWEAKRRQVITLLVALMLLTGIFFFQKLVTRNERLHNGLRTGFLIFTLVYIGWYANAQLSVVNVLAVFSALVSDFRWETFLMDPLIFVLWFAVAAALLFWGRGAYCGWLCPFGALQELTNKIARWAKMPQVTIPWGLHERLWAVKYILFLGLFGMSLYALDFAEHYAEIEPFKTAIILKFQRSWPYVLFAITMLLPGLFIERFYCRYVCPLGAALAITARLHMFRWLKRYPECSNPCRLCERACPVQAIHPEGEINPNECISCLNCQVLYQHKTKCPVVVKQIKKWERLQAQIAASSFAGQPSVTRKAKSKLPTPADQLT